MTLETVIQGHVSGSTPFGPSTGTSVPSVVLVPPLLSFSCSPENFLLLIPTDGADPSVKGGSFHVSVGVFCGSDSRGSVDVRSPTFRYVYERRAILGEVRY